MLRVLYTDEIVEITTITDIYDIKTTMDEDNNPIEEEILIKKNAKSRHTIYIRDVKSVGEVFDEKGKIVKNRVYLQHIDHGKLHVEGTYKEFQEIIFNKLINKQEQKVGYGRQNN